MTDPRPTYLSSLGEAIASGMAVAFHAQQKPNRIAIRSPFGELSFAELNANCNRISRTLSAAGLKKGDAVALISRNRPEFVETYHACLRSGFRVTPINWHLKPDEVAYIVSNCEAKALIADADFAASAEEAASLHPLVVKLAVGGPITKFSDYHDTIAQQSGDNIANPTLGGNMLYTSGTTGRPKGVFKPANGAALTPSGSWYGKSADFQSDTDVALVTGPLYHAAPLGINLNVPLMAGLEIVLMDKWDAEETLRLTEQYKVTHSHLVATMFHRLLQLPEEIKQKYNSSSLRWIIHGAAPCPIEAKQGMMDWFGPVLYEYYGGTEGGGIFILPEEWLKKPGSVGRINDNTRVEIHDEEGNILPVGETGTIYFNAPATGRFKYFKDPEKTKKAYRNDLFTLGDMGYLDKDDYLYLTGRSAEIIISGGVNVYPQETDNALLTHPAVKDVCTIGVPSEEWGEEVKSVVQLVPNTEITEGLKKSLIQHCKDNLPGYKCPRSIDFTTDLPRLPTGKILRREVRLPYWKGRTKQI